MTAPTPPPSGTRWRPGDLTAALTALENRRDCPPAAPDRTCDTKRGRTVRRSVLALLFVALIAGGVLQVSSVSSPGPDLQADGSRANVVFSNAQTGTCLNWPPDSPDKPSFVQCRGDHMFEVAKPVGMNNFGEPCQLAVHEYLGGRYDPNSKFTISVLWAGDVDGTHTGDRNLLCGLQLLGPGGTPIAFKGRIAELDQSKIWPAGTCLGIDPNTTASTDIPVDCATPHALEVTGAVNVGERFPGGLPSDPEQSAFVAETCTRLADEYLAPMTLAASGLVPNNAVVSPASWSAGSRQVSCSVGRPAPTGWTATVGNARSLSPADVPATPTTTTAPTAEAPPPPPVYQEPLVPVGPVPAEVPPAAPSTPPPATETTVPPPPVETTTAAPAEIPPPNDSPGPPPGPQPGVIEIPGFAPITLPGAPPPAPPPAG